MAPAFSPRTSTPADWMMPISLYTCSGTTITTRTKSYIKFHGKLDTEFVP
jgi:hypothetical protein